MLAEVHGGSTATPTPDGRALVFARENLIPLRWRISGASNVEWNDLYRLDLETGEQRLLTNGRRADEPDVSPDGALIACTIGRPGTRQLAVVPIDGGVPRVLGADLPGFAYTPTWSPDGRFVTYSRWEPGGFRDIHVFDVGAGTDSALAHDRAMDVDPRFSPDGRYIVFSSDRTGIYNVFAYERATARLFQVTNVLDGAFQPAISPDGKLLVYMGFTSAGYDLFSTPFDPWSWSLAQPFANGRPDAPADVGSVADSPDATPGEAPVGDVVERIEPYRPWKYFYPHLARVNSRHGDETAWRRQLGACAVWRGRSGGQPRPGDRYRHSERRRRFGALRLLLRAPLAVVRAHAGALGRRSRATSSSTARSVAYRQDSRRARASSSLARAAHAPTSRATSRSATPTANTAPPTGCPSPIRRTGSRCARPPAPTRTCS